MSLFSFFGRNSLRALYELDDHRLDDLGLCRADLAAARGKSRSAVAGFLSARRQKRAGAGRI